MPTQPIPSKPNFITAIATPLREDDSLHEEGLEKLIDFQLQAEIGGLLVGGTMGLMQLQTPDTYRLLMRRSIDFADGRTELLAGAGDVSFSNTCQRIEFLNTLPLDGVVVLPPYLIHFRQDELIDYYRSLAGLSRAPLYLYDLPQITHVKLELDTVLAIATHPNIRGIKCSDEPSYARQLIDLIGDRFRIVMAAPLLMDVFLRQGVMEHLDGVYCLFPRQVVGIGEAAQEQDWERAAHLQQGINRTMRLLRKHGLWLAFTALMNTIGVPGRMKPRPHRQWDASETRTFLEDEETQAILRFLRGELLSAPKLPLVAEGAGR